MSCASCHEQIMDVLYGEELRPEACFLFFRHLDSCKACHREYEELLGTRNLLADWKIEETNLQANIPASIVESSGRVSAPWWNSALRVAAVFLMLVGAWGILDRLGLAGTERRMVSQPELMQMVNDMIVVQQGEERMLMGRALMEFADELMTQQQVELLRVSQDLQDLDRRYLQVMEETTDNLRALATR